MNMIGDGTVEILCLIFSLLSVCIVHIILKGHQEYNCYFGLTRNVRDRIGFYLVLLLCKNKVVVIIGLYLCRVCQSMTQTKNYAQEFNMPFLRSWKVV